MPYEIVVHDSAAEEIQRLRVFDQRRIISQIEQQLSHQPTVVTRRRKCLGPLVATFEHEQPIWRLRVDEYRVFYDVDEQSQHVHVRAVRRKETDQQRSIYYEDHLQS
jgi:mRNA-degrading endonuclease RelE of RelBE toxin-antitoxin system